MRVLVTGGCGFVGSHVVDLLVERGHEVTVVDNLDRSVHSVRPTYLNPRATYHEVDLNDEPAMVGVLGGVDAVDHQAALVGVGRGLDDAPRFVYANGLATAVVLALSRAAGVRRFVLASSMVVYGEGAYACAEHGAQRAAPRRESDLRSGRFDPACSRCGAALRPEPVTEDAPLDPRSVYAATKVHQEHLAFVAMREGGPAVTALRYHNVYGPRMPRETPYAGVASLMRTQIAAGEAPRVFEDGRQLRDFVHVRDVARANVLALEGREAIVGAFNIGSGEPRTIHDLATALARELGSAAPRVTGEYRLGDVRHVFASAARAARDLGFASEVPFDVGMAEFARAELREPAA